MDSRLAADTNARRILDILAQLENATGIRAHYRILDPPPLSTLDSSAFQTALRVISDWIGLRNAIFHVTALEPGKPASIMRTDIDQEEFAVMVPESDLSSTALALSTAARMAAETYLLNSNIGSSSIESRAPDPLLVDTTAMFLGLGKLLLNNPATRPLHSNALAIDDYPAFTFRLVCAMRGLDWTHQTAGLTPEATTRLRSWDQYRDSVFSQSLRNVLTASISHRPLLDVLSDNHLALAKLDQLGRAISAQVVDPLKRLHREYHEHCRLGYEKVTAKEQDTYDPCMLYLNQVRSRMDLQRYTDMLAQQEKLIDRKVAEIAAAIGELEKWALYDEHHSTGELFAVVCPFDGTRIPLNDTTEPQKVKCPGCGYIFFGCAGSPDYRAEQREGIHPDDRLLKTTGGNRNKENGESAASSLQDGTQGQTGSRKKVSFSLLLACSALVILAGSWIPLLGTFFYSMFRHTPIGGTRLLGTVGIIGSLTAALLLLLSLFVWLFRLTKKTK